MHIWNPALSRTESLLSLFCDFIVWNTKILPWKTANRKVTIANHQNKFSVQTINVYGIWISHGINNVKSPFYHPLLDRKFYHSIASVIDLYISGFSLSSNDSTGCKRMWMCYNLKIFTSFLFTENVLSRPELQNVIYWIFIIFSTHLEMK